MGKKHLTRKIRPFDEQSRAKRKLSWIQLRNAVRKNADFYGGRFTSDELWEVPDEGRTFSQWADIVFPGTKKYRIWNATVLTVWQVMLDIAEEEAHKKALEMLSPDEQEHIWEKGSLYPQFGALSYVDYLAKLEQETLEALPYPIYEEFCIEPGYRYGTGLVMVIDAERISQAAVEQAIDHFISLGEQNWRAAEPVPQERLRELRGGAKAIRL